MTLTAALSRRAARWACHARRLGAAVCVMLAAGAAHAADHLDAIKQRGVLVVGVKTDYPPFGMLSSEAVQQGLEHDLAANLAERLGVKLRTVGVTTTNRLQVLDEGQVDVTIATLGDSIERRQIATLVEPDYYASGVTLMTRPDSTIEKWADIRGKPVCATQGSYFNRTMATRYLLNLQIYANGRDAKLGVRDRRCVGWLFDNTAIEGDLLSSEWHDYQIKLPSELQTPWAIALPRADQGRPLDRFISDTVADWHRQGTLIALEGKWHLPPSTFLADMHTLWTRKDANGRYVCSREADGRWPVACRNPAFVTSADLTGLRSWGLRLYERTGINLTFVYDDYERHAFLHALWLTLALTFCCVSGSLLCGVAFALVAARDIPIVSAVTRVLALVGRMTPPLLQIYVLLFGFGSLAAARLGLQFDAFFVVVVALSLYTGTGIMRVLEDAARHERKLSPHFTLKLSTLGLLIRRASASVTALLVNVTKATMMASAVAVPELLSVSTSIIAEHGNVATMMNTLLVFFVLLVFGVLRLLRYAERRWCDGD